MIFRSKILIFSTLLCNISLGTSSKNDRPLRRFENGVPVDHLIEFHGNLFWEGRKDPKGCPKGHKPGDSNEPSMRDPCETGPICQVTIIHVDWTLLPAHCLLGQGKIIDQMTIGHGHEELWKMMHYPIEYVIIHQEFELSATYTNYDIALAKSKFPFSIYRRPLPVLNHNKLPKLWIATMYSRGKKQGWKEEKFSKLVNFIDVNDMSHDCEKEYDHESKWDLNLIICYVLLSAELGTHHGELSETRGGDSGSPIIANDLYDSSKRYLIGFHIRINNISSLNGEYVKAGINVAGHIEWILYNMRRAVNENDIKQNQRVIRCCDETPKVRENFEHYNDRRLADIRTEDTDKKPDQIPAQWPPTGKLGESFGNDTDEQFDGNVLLFTEEMADESCPENPVKNGVRRRRICETKPYCNGVVYSQYWIISLETCIQKMDISKITIGYGHHNWMAMLHFPIEFVVRDENRMKNAQKGENIQDDYLMIKLKDKLPIEQNQIPILNFLKIPPRSEAFIVGFQDAKTNHIIRQKSPLKMRNYECESAHEMEFNDIDQVICYQLKERPDYFPLTIPGALILAKKKDQKKNDPYYILGIHSSMGALFSWHISVMRGINMAGDAAYWFKAVKYLDDRDTLSNVISSNLWIHCCNMETIEKMKEDHKTYWERDYQEIMNHGIPTC